MEFIYFLRNQRTSWEEVQRSCSRSELYVLENFRSFIQELVENRLSVAERENLKVVFEIGENSGLVAKLEGPDEIVKKVTQQ